MTARTAAPEPTEAGRRFASLARLVPNAEGFLADAFGRERRRAAFPGGPPAAEALFDWPRLNQALAEHRMAPPRLRLEQAGADVTSSVLKSRRNRRGTLLQDVDAEALTARLRDGATLILDAANEISPPLQALCEGLSAEFLSACQANLYACWGATQGFDVHWDDHEVFIVQVAGRKRWRLYGVTRAWPRRKDFHGAHDRPQAPLEEFVMTPGEVLYLPRGHWHAAVGIGEPSLHLTIGLTRKAGTDFLHWLADQSAAEAQARADLPLEADDAVLGGRIADLVVWAGQQDPKALARAYRRQVAAGQAHRPRLSFPFIGRETERPGPEDRVRLASGAAGLEPADSPEEVVLAWRGTHFTISARLEPAIRRLVGGEAVALSALNAAGRPEQVAAFVDAMLARGVFVLEGRGR